VIVDAAKPFKMGSPLDERGRYDNETQHDRKIGRRYAIAASPVTKKEFSRFLSDHPEEVAEMTKGSIDPNDDSPQTGLNWYVAAEYCNWLSEMDGIAKDQQCYEPNEQRKFAPGMRVKDNYHKLKGYRLPTEAEWECACRAGTSTRFYFGETEALLGNYAWFRDDSRNHSWPVASLKPNDVGLFDMHGNVWQWCECPKQDYPDSGHAVVEEDGDGATRRIANDLRVELRGGAYNNLPHNLRAACRYLRSPESREEELGFRPVRTINP
jgi:formylglycine-generating enzyme required for sulfatase activity